MLAKKASYENSNEVEYFETNKVLPYRVSCQMKRYDLKLINLFMFLVCLNVLELGAWMKIEDYIISDCNT